MGTAAGLGNRTLVLRMMLAVLTGVMVAALPSPAPAHADATGPAAVCTRVRATGPTAARLLERGIELSGTFRQLIAILEQSDLIVHVETAFRRKVRGVCLLRGETRVAATTSRGRFLRITVSLPGVECELLSTLGHELQHAVEIAAAPDVTDDAARIRITDASASRSAGRRGAPWRHRKRGRVCSRKFERV